MPRLFLSFSSLFPKGERKKGQITGQPSTGPLRKQQTTVSRQLPKKGHREVASETLLPIILEVGTLGHILLTDPRSHVPSRGLVREKMSSEGFHRLPKDYGGNGCLLSLSPSSALLRRKKERGDKREGTRWTQPGTTRFPKGTKKRP